MSALTGAVRLVATAKALRAVLVGAATLVGLSTASAAVSSARTRQEPAGAGSEQG